ncbi:CHAD domain-containing protein [Corynebacterium atypicum]|uniref:CHAD domain-containing protein n=1 Tax=Corynebacterium atypicum TaxID=191610 RepID=UPI000689FA24|nr:CYTH domain-containing protein [Corynebacterium atypicum]
MSTSAFLEVEQTYAAQQHTEVPDLTRIAEVDLSGDPADFHLFAIYFDTEDLRLTREKITLRRRTGGHDDGWHLKLPSTDGRMEISAPLAATVPDTGAESDAVYPEPQPPQELVDRVRAIVRNHRLVPVAEVANHRSEIELLGPDRHPVAHFCDDRVDARALLTGEDTSWREWELELTADTAGTALGAAVMQSATEIFAAAGAKLSDSPSKLVRALGSSLGSAPHPPAPQGFSDTAQSDPCARILAELAESRRTLLAADPGARTGRTRAIRQMLHATRQVRHLIYLYASLFVDADSPAAADERLDRLVSAAAKLAYLARVLEEADDTHDVDRRLRALFDADRTGLVAKSTAELLTGASRTQLTRARARLQRTLASAEYLAVLDDLDSVLVEPPFPSHAEQRKVGGVIVREVKRAFIDYRNERRTTSDLMAHPQATHRDLATSFKHMLVTAQALATIAELADRLTEYRSGKLARQADKLAAELHQAVISDATCALIMQRARQARRHGQDTFGFGVLYQAESSHFTQITDALRQRRGKTRSAFKRFKKSTSRR